MYLLVIILTTELSAVVSGLMKPEQSTISTSIKVIVRLDKSLRRFLSHSYNIFSGFLNFAVRGVISNCFKDLIRQINDHKHLMLYRIASCVVTLTQFYRG